MNFIPGLVVGVAIGAGIAHLVWANSQNNIPFNIDDTKSVISKLRPLARNGNTDVSIFLWGDGQVHINVELDYSSKISGKGSSLRDAVEDMKQKSARIGLVLQ